MIGGKKLLVRPLRSRELAANHLLLLTGNHLILGANYLLSAAAVVIRQQDVLHQVPSAASPGLLPLAPSPPPGAPLSSASNCDPGSFWTSIAIARLLAVFELPFSIE